jgi:CDP-diacylglycerol--glycerol-3-phosphate 3-phosphatidyltransferase
VVLDEHRVKRRSSLREDALNLPNTLTFIRILLIPAVLAFMVQGTRAGNIFAVFVFTVAAVTDLFDGWLARRRGLTSLLGQFLDPLADKLLILAVLVLAVELGRIPAWPVIIILARELCVTALRTIAVSEGLVISASQGGKDKAALQNAAVSMIIVYNTYPIDFWFFKVTVSLNTVGFVLLIASIVFALTSGGAYIRMFIDAVEAKEKRSRDSLPAPRS